MDQAALVSVFQLTISQPSFSPYGILSIWLKNTLKLRGVKDNIVNSQS